MVEWDVVLCEVVYCVVGFGVDLVVVVVVVLCVVCVILVVIEIVVVCVVVCDVGNGW